MSKAKAAFEALKRDGARLLLLVTECEKAVNNFDKLSSVYASCSVESIDYKALNDFFRGFFRLYLYAIDDAMVLFTGSLCREYHQSQHSSLFRREDGRPESALHSRGREGAYFSSDRFSRCSVDGFNFEFRKVENAISASKYDDAMTGILASVDDLSKRLENLMKTAQSSFEKAVNRILDKRNTQALHRSINLAEHLGESFSFQLRSPKNRKLQDGRTSAELIGFSFSREDEAKTSLYRTHRDLSQEASYSIEYGKIAKYLGGDARLETRALGKRRVVLGSDDDSEEEDGSLPQRKFPVPLASELCKLSDTDTFSSGAPLRQGGVPDGRNTDTSLSHFTESISAIKRPFSNLDYADLNTVALESTLKNPQAAYVKESTLKVSRQTDHATKRAGPGNYASQSGVSEAASRAEISAEVAEPKNSDKCDQESVPWYPLKRLRNDWKTIVCPSRNTIGKRSPELSFSSERYSAAVSRTSPGEYAVAGSRDQSCISAIGILNKCIDLIWSKFFWSNSDGPNVSVPGIPFCIVPSSGEQIEADGVLCGSEHVTTVHILCADVECVPLFREFATSLRDIMLHNKDMSKPQMMIPPVAFLRALNSAAKNLNDKMILLLDLSDSACLQLDSAEGWSSLPVKCECSDGTVRPRSWQYIWTATALGSMRKISKTVGLNLSFLQPPTELFSHALVSCHKLICRGCAVRWTMVAEALLDCAQGARSATGDRCSAKNSWWFAETEDETIYLQHLDFSSNGNLLTTPSELTTRNLFDRCLKFNLMVESQSDFAGRISKEQQLLQLCFDFLLLLPVSLNFVDFSYCVSSADEAVALCELVLSSLSRRKQNISRTPIELLIIRGLYDYLPAHALGEFSSRLANVDGCGVTTVVLQ